MNGQIRVLYDAEGFRSPFGGVPYSLVEMIRQLPPSISPILAVRRTCNLALQREPFGIAGHPDLYHSFISSREFRGKWRLWRLAQRLLPRWYRDYDAENDNELVRLLERGEFDVLHLTGAHVYGHAWRMVAGKKPIVVTVHDLIPELVEGNVRIAKARREMLAAATHVIAVSDNTRRDLVRLYGISEKKISVIYHGGPMWGDVQAGADGAVRQEKYLLFVGRREGYKNWNWMVNALTPLLKNGLRLICTGHPFTAAERHLLRRLGVMDRVMQRTVADAEFPLLYAGAEAFVYPSLYEGFGLPILDAFAAGCPVVLSNRSCFPEIAADGAEYFDPDDPESLRRTVARLFDDPCHRANLVEKGKARLGCFSWEKTSRRTAEIYAAAIGLRVEG